MAKPHWHIIREPDALTLARRLPVRFDICAVAELPSGGLLRMATQIRQDMWRALQHLRGFSPVVRVTRERNIIKAEAGGRVDTPTFPKAQAEAAIEEILANPVNLARWTRYANGGHHG